MAGLGIGNRIGAAIAICLVGLLVDGLLVAEQAHAGSYYVNVCHDAAGTAVPSDLFETQSPVGYLTPSNTCTANDQGAVGAVVGPCVDCTYGNDGIAYYLIPPLGVSISAYSARLREVTQPCDAPQGSCTDGRGLVYVIDSQRSEPDYAFVSRGQGFGGPFTVGAGGLGASYLKFYAGCDASTGRCAANRVVAALYLSHLGVRLADSTTPTAAASGGMLLSGRPVTGTQAATFTAADSGAGIYAQLAYVDGKLVQSEPIDNNNGRCVDRGTVPGMHDFAYLRPCKQFVNAVLNLDTTQLADGNHTLNVLAEDAAGDRATVYNGPLTTANAPSNSAPPTVGGVTQLGAPLGGSPGTWQAPGDMPISYGYQWLGCDAAGQNCAPRAGATGTSYTLGVEDVYRTVRLAVTATDRSGSAIALSAPTAAIADAQGNISPDGFGGLSGALTGSRGVGGLPGHGGCAPRASSSMRSTGAHKALLSVHLFCDGAPLAATPVVLQDDHGLRRQLTTDSDGAFVVELTRLQSHLSVTVGGTTLPLSPQLRAISLAISPRRTSNFHAMHWHGTVTGGHPGMRLLLEFRKGRGWGLFDQATVDRTGHFHYRYTFRSTTGTVRYTFRVLARDGSAVSPSRSVIVHG
ncbi:MAG: hypothetical protein NVS1B9_02140 [Solirubrobacteraceae bacterium]